MSNNCLDNISPNQLAILAAAIAVDLSGNKTAAEVNVLGNLVAAIGASLLTIAAQMENVDKGK